MRRIAGCLMKYYILPFGCQMNRSDSERIRGVLEGMGYEPSGDENDPDVVVKGIVACSVRQKAIDRVYGRIRNWNREKSLRPVLTFVTGCILEADKAKFLKLFDLVFSIDCLPELPDMIRQYGVPLPGSVPGGSHAGSAESGAEGGSPERKTALLERMQPFWDLKPRYTSAVEAYIPIQNGCNKFCSFCAVPYTRGREVSRSSDDILKELEALVESGCKSITLLGQNVNSYGGKRAAVTFPELLRRVSQVDGIERIRFATSHPKDLSQDLIQTIAEADKVCNHLHLPVQSGANRILKKMNRGYTRETYLSRINALKAACPQIALSTDMIVGFPSETHEDFMDTMALLDEVEFDSIFAFAYSARFSAPAAKFPDQVDETVKMERLNTLLAHQEIYTERKNKATEGKILQVLVEGESPKPRAGFAAAYPDMKQMFGRSESNKIVHFPSDQAKIGDLINIRIDNAYPHSLWGEVAEC